MIDVAKTAALVRQTEALVFDFDDSLADSHLHKVGGVRDLVC